MRVSTYRARTLLKRRPVVARQPPISAFFTSGESGKEFSLCKIVATIGPASEQADTLPPVVQAGLSVMRVNFSHATDEEVQLRLKNLGMTTGMFPLDGENQMLRSVMLDTKGPEIRTGGLQAVHDTGDIKAKIQLTTGSSIILTHDEAYSDCGTPEKLFVTYPSLATTVVAGSTVLLDDGAVSLTVTSVDTLSGEIFCTVENDGEIASRRGVNLPGSKVDLPPMSEKDKEDIKYGIQNDMDFVAASFVRKATDIQEIRSWISKCHAEVHGAGSSYPEAKVIAKVESTEALENLDEITDAADGIMVARGDLGVEVPLEEVVIWQKEMVEKCIAAAPGKPVVVATQMLESMQKSPRPTRAEVSDVTNAVLDGADCVMLSGESANGSYPIESVATMQSIIRTVESWAPPSMSLEQMLQLSGSKEDTMAASAVFTSEKLSATMIVVNGKYGNMARLVSKFRPSVPILALVDNARVARQLSIHRGVYPTLLSEAEALPAAVSMGMCKPGDQVVNLVVNSEDGILSMSIGNV